MIGDEAPVVASRPELDADLEMMGRVPRAEEAPAAASTATPSGKEPAAPVAGAVGGDLAQLAREAIKDKRLAEAEQLIEQAKAASPGSGEVPDLLSRLARGYRRVKQFRMAAEKYRALIFEYPQSNAGKNALVALAQMELGALGEPASALDHFGLYLEMAPGGMLAQEARIGRVRALARLGRNQEVIAAAGQYLGAGQSGVAAAELHRRRGDAKAATGNCQGAVKDYRTVIDKWPTSAEAKRAEQGLGKCGEEKQP
jgi:tetratricopeptide (TPR) repeat protein